MLNRVLRFSLSNRLLTLVVAAILILGGFYSAGRLPIDVLPDLTRSRVTVLTECPGLAPEEVETLVTIPLESTLVGAAKAETVRSSSVVGLSTIIVEFGWNVDPYLARQIVFERLQKASSDLPDGISPQLAPSASVMGQFLTLAVYSESGEISPMELRSIADWDVRRKLLAQRGIADVFAMGGERRQYQALLRPADLTRYGVTVDDVKSALEKSDRNVTGGFLSDQGPNQLLVRSIGRLGSIDDLRSLVVKASSEPPVQLFQVADIKEGASVAVGDGSIAVKLQDGSVFEGPAVVLTAEKQPNVDSRSLTEQILKETSELRRALREKYPDLVIAPVYQQRTYIELAVGNALTALRDGAILVAIVVFLFLGSWRTTIVALTAIQTTLAITCLIFARFGLTINTMTLGGLAVAVGELVDDAIVDVENIQRRLNENARLGSPLSQLAVVFGASSEIRKSVVNGPLTTVLVFFPVFFLSGIEGKLFAPLGVSYIVSLISSLFVSLTLTPVLSYSLLKRKSTKNATKGAKKPNFVLRIALWFAERAVRFSLKRPNIALSFALGFFALGALVFLTLERDFMPPFNEGAIQVDLDLAPGSSLETSSEIATNLVSQLIQIDGIASAVRKTGRSESDEHAVPVNSSEIVCSIDPDSDRNFSDIVDDVRGLLDPENIPGTLASYEQPLQHLLNHLRSGSSSKIVVKLRGENLLRLRERARLAKEPLREIDDVGSLRTEPIQANLPQVQIRLKRDKLALYGLTPDDVEQTVLIALNGSIATTALDGERRVEVVAKLGSDYRENLEVLRRLPIRLPSKALSFAAERSDLAARLSDETFSNDEATVPLSEVAEIDAQAQGVAQIDRENGRRQVAIQCNPRRRGVVEVKQDIESALKPHWEELTSDGVDVSLSGLFEDEANATRTLVLLSGFSALAIFLVLYHMFRSANLALQVMALVPLALVGGVLAIKLTGQPRAVPSLIGMISLCGVAARNGVLLMERYLRLVEYEGEELTPETILRAGKERTAPVLMTALTSIIGLIPLALAPNLPGREFLYPIATVMIGGLIVSTAMEFFVRPALFLTYGLEAARRVVEKERAKESNPETSEDFLASEPTRFEVAKDRSLSESSDSL